MWPYVADLTSFKAGEDWEIDSAEVEPVTGDSECQKYINHRIAELNFFSGLW